MKLHFPPSSDSDTLIKLLLFLTFLAGMTLPLWYINTHDSMSTPTPPAQVER
jgi:hypothetical protein